MIPLSNLKFFSYLTKTTAKSYHTRCFHHRVRIYDVLTLWFYARVRINIFSCYWSLLITNSFPSIRFEKTTYFHVWTFWAYWNQLHANQFRRWIFDIVCYCSCRWWHVCIMRSGSWNLPMSHHWERKAGTVIRNTKMLLPYQPCPLHQSWCSLVQSTCLQIFYISNWSWLNEVSHFCD